MSNKENLVESLQPLVADGTLTLAQRDAVINRLSVSEGAAASRSLKGLISEAILYLGGAVIFGSGALLISQTWDDLGRWGRPGVLVVAAVVLWVAGVLIYNRKQDDEGRRLTSTLLSGAAGLVGFAATYVTRELWIPLDPAGYEDWRNVPRWVDPAQVLIALGLVFIIGVLAYRTASSALALGVIGGSALGVALSLAQLINVWLGPDVPRDQFVEETLPWLAAGLVGGGSFVWLWMWRKEIFREQVIAHILGLLGIFIAINTMRESYSDDSVSLLLVIAGAVGLWLYVQSHSWPYLAFGLGSILMGGIQILFTYVEGIGGALASMALGAVLIFVGSRLVKDKPQIETH